MALQTQTPPRNTRQGVDTRSLTAGGRPIEDRSFEAVETAACAACGLALGSALAGPVGAIVGAIIGGAAGLEAGEALERSMGRVAETTDADPNDDISPPAR